MRVICLLLATLTLCLLAASAPALDDCLGCGLDPNTDKSDEAECNTCFVTLWSVTSDWEEDCGDNGVDCDDADCSYNFKVKYKTAACTGQTFTFTPVIISGDPIGLPASATSRVIINETIERLCGLKTNFKYKIVNDACPTVKAEISGKNGCAGCNAPGPPG